MQFLIHKTGGKFTNIGRLREHNDSLPDGSYLVTVDPSNKRSNDQNAYYWACVVDPVFHGLRDMGFDEVRTKEDAHEIMKGLFLKKQVANEHGEVIEWVRSTTELTTIEFAAYLLDVMKWAAEYLQVVIEEPNTQLNFAL